MRTRLKSFSSCCSESKMFVSVVTLVVFSLMGPVNTAELSYDELRAMQPSCGPKDTCSTSKRNRLDYSMDWKDRHCFCDHLCSEYGDCCIDSDFRQPEEEKKSFDNHQCVKMKQYGDIYMKGTCMTGWQDEGIAQECYNAAPSPFSKKRDPVRDMPVTSKTSRITYKNYFCAVCNSDSLALEFWKPRIECSEGMKEYNAKFGNLTLKYVYNNLIHEDGTWGMHLDTAFNGNPDFQICSIDPQMPHNVVDMIRKCKCTEDKLNYKQCNRPVSTCNSTWTDASVKNLCHSYTALIYDHDSIAYRNIHCAMCNYVETEVLQCTEPHSFGRSGFTSQFNPRAFSLLFDFTDFSGSNIVGSVCDADEIWDPFFKQCRNVVCGKENHEYKFGKCSPIGDVNDSVSTEEVSPTPETTSTTVTIANRNNNVPILFPGDPGPATEISEGTTVLPATDVPTKNSTSQTLVCDRILLPKGDFEMDANGTVYVEKYNSIYQKTEYEIHRDGILVCTISPESGKFSPLMGHVTLAGLSLSCLGILTHLIAFLIVPDLRNLSGKNLASLCIVLLAAYATFILGIFGESGKTECFIVAAAMYYFFLSSFCWMNIMAFDIWRTLRMATSELRVSQGGQWRKFIFYSLYGWLVPLAALVVVVLLDTASPEGFPKDFLPSLGQRWCWFGQRKALLIFFAAPLATLMGVNFIFFVFSARIIADTQQSTSKMSSCNPHQDQFKLYMRLALLMGLTWISGIVAGYLQMEAIWYAFVLLNTLQGVFIFLAFTCTRKVWRVLSGPCCRKMPIHSPSWNTRSSSSSRQGLDSNISHSQLSANSSMAHLTANTSRGSNDSY
ncbi:unnamed protein product [Meganyctiphanes norvegica]|uniref:G-protein coupled receptor Mth2 n=1 Tax=Meganyctiphanes norvegica TaxID=48144 RepID=A0AAV2Q4P3_MEGNR